MLMRDQKYREATVCANTTCEETAQAFPMYPHRNLRYRNQESPACMPLSLPIRV